MDLFTWLLLFLFEQLMLILSEMKDMPIDKETFSMPPLKSQFYILMICSIKEQYSSVMKEKNQ